MPLAGSERSGSRLQWRMTDFSAQLLKRTVQLAELSRNIEAQDRLLRLAEQTFEHLWSRRIEDGHGAGLWDDVRAVFPDAKDVNRRLSWSVTERVTECLVAARNLYEQEPIRSPDLADLARDLLSEATHLFGREQLEASTGDDGSRARAMRSIENRLDHARGLVDERPATAFALALPVLRELDTLAQARTPPRRRAEPCSSSRPPTRRHGPLGHQRQPGLPACPHRRPRRLRRLRLRLAHRRRRLRRAQRPARHRGTRPALYLEGEVTEPASIDIWRHTEHPVLRARQNQSGRLVLYPGDAGGGEFATGEEALERCVDLLLRLNSEFDLVMVDLSASRSYAVDLVLAATAHPQMRHVSYRWLVFHRWTRQHVIAAAGLVHKENGILRGGVDRGHDEHTLQGNIRFVRAAVPDPESAMWAQGSPAQAAWMQSCNRALRRSPPTSTSATAWCSAPCRWSRSCSGGNS